MSGFGVQKEPYFTEKLNQSISSLLKALKDPALPLMEMRVRKEGRRKKINYILYLEK